MEISFTLPQRQLAAQPQRCRIALPLNESLPDSRRNLTAAFNRRLGAQLEELP
jgi:hypothetical protein